MYIILNSELTVTSFLSPSAKRSVPDFRKLKIRMLYYFLFILVKHVLITYLIDVSIILVVFSGERVKPLVIGKSQKPWCFKSVTIDGLPVTYMANKKAWMNGHLYKEWMRWFDKKMTGCKVLLFVDNALSVRYLELTIRQNQWPFSATVRID